MREDDPLALAIARGIAAVLFQAVLERRVEQEYRAWLEARPAKTAVKRPQS